MANLNPLRIQWASDIGFQERTGGAIPQIYGPDGPWQAAMFGIGTSRIEPNGSLAPQGSPSYPLILPFYPTGAGICFVPTPAAGGYYTPGNSSTAHNSSRVAGPFVTSGDWEASLAFNTTVYLGQQVFDYTTIQEANSYDTAVIGGNVTIQALSTWAFPVPSNSTSTPPRQYNFTLGTFGIGPISGVPSSEGFLLDQIKNTGRITSNSFGLHIGSAPLNISGSLILGGYDQSRAIGPVGSFWYRQNIAYAILLDINLGTANGSSPFPPVGSEHLLRNADLSNNAASVLSQQFGAPDGSIMVIPDSGYPYIALPVGVCEAAAAHLPVVFDKEIGFYTWDTSSPAYAAIVSSPAYMEFVLADSTAANISIKVPFALLNLTLEAPITKTPTPYFPCHSMETLDGFGAWQLGRAFLQAAHLAINYEQNITWIVQAPGPAIGQSVVYNIEPNDTTIRSDPLNDFGASWSNHWRPLDEQQANQTIASSGQTDNASAGGLTHGAIAGIALGCIFGVSLIVACPWFLRKRSRKRHALVAFSQSSSKVEIDGSEQEGIAVDQGSRREVQSGLARLEPDSAERHECDVPAHPYEVEAPLPWHELSITKD